MLRYERLAAVLVSVLALCILGSSRQACAASRKLDRDAVIQSYASLPLSFEVNRGQTDSQVRFLSRGHGYTLFFTDSAAVLALTRTEGSEAVDELREREPGNQGRNVDLRNGDTVRMELVSASRDASVRGADQLPGTVNYFVGNDPKMWRSGVPAYGKVKYESVYPGVDLIYYGNQRQLEYDFVVAPGADPRTIRMRFSAPGRLSLAANGDLRIAATHGEVALRRPVVYQMLNGRRQPIHGKFQLLAKNQVGFWISAYDRSRPLIIDPILTYATYLGGSNGSDYASGIVLDSSGNMYITGRASSTDFPTTQGSLQTGNSNGINEAFVVKLSSTGDKPVYVTYLGGQGGANATAIAVDGSGNAYITGSTGSGQFPTTTGAFQTKPPSYARSAGFVSKLSADGSSLVFSTFLAGEGENGFSSNSCTAIAVDTSGHTFVTGSTSSPAFPTTSGVFQSTDIGASDGVTDAFVSEFSSDGTSLVYSTYLGGTTGNAFGTAIALDANDDVYLTGYTSATDFPVSKNNPFQFTLTGSQAAFVTALKSGFSTLIYSTYLGGTGSDSGYGIAVDGVGNAYVTGQATSSDFPVFPNPGAYQTSLAGNANAFVTKVNPDGTKLVYSSYLGGSGTDSAAGISIDGLGEAFITGSTNSSDFPITPNALGKNAPAGQNAFVSKLNSTATGLLYSTYLGGSQKDSASAIVLDTSGTAYVAGKTTSTDFPVTTGALDIPSKSSYCEAIGCSDGFAAALAIGGETTTALTSSNNPQLQNFPVTFTAVVTANFSDQVPTGSAVFTIDGGTGITVALDDTGKAAYNPSSPLTPQCGGHTITVAYSGDSNFLTSTGNLTETIVGAPATIAVASGSNGVGTYGSFFGNPLVAIVKDSCGNPVFNSVVTFSGAGLTFSTSPTVTGPNPGSNPLQVTTGSNGEATVYAYATAAGTPTAMASVTGSGGTPVTTTFPLTAKPAPLTCKVTSISIEYDAAIPLLSYQCTGFVNGDTASVLTGSPLESTTAMKGSPVLGSPYLITISQGTLADPNYTFTFVPGELTIVKAKQIIKKFTISPTLQKGFVYGTKYTVSAIATSGLPVTLEVTGPAKINNQVLTILSGLGEITITASQSGDSNWKSVSQKFGPYSAERASQSITFTAPSSPVKYDHPPISLKATASSGLPVSFTVVSGPGRVKGDMLTITGVGTIDVEACQSGNSDYLPVSPPKCVKHSVVVEKASQSIDFKKLPAEVTVGKTVTLSATATSGLPVTFTVSGPAKLKGDKLTLIGAGKVTVTAEQSGNADYDPAKNVVQTVPVVPAG